MTVLPEEQTGENTVTHPPPSLVTLPLARLTRVLCPKGERGRSALSFVILAVIPPPARRGSVSERGRSRRQNRERVGVGGGRRVRRCEGETVDELVMQEGEEGQKEDKEEDEEEEEGGESAEEGEEFEEEEEEEEEEEPFGTLRATSEEQLCAIVMAVASAK